IYTGSSDALVRDNVSYDNNDHGIDISTAPNSTVVSNTVVGNNSSGINVEGGSTGTTVRDNIAVDNTAIPDRSKGDIRVDAVSVQGTTLDHDLVFESPSSTAPPIFEWNGITYTSFAAFRTASGQETNGLVTDPAFVSLAGRDLRLTGISPAVDAADSTVAGWTAPDHDKVQPVDDPKVADRGSGNPTYADLGALEFIGAVALPPTTSVASPDGLTITVDASNSGTLGEQPTQRTIDCGNGDPAVDGNTATCVYPASGSYTVTVAVTGAVVNGHSWSDTASTVVDVQKDLPPVAALALTRSMVGIGVSTTADASGSSDDHPPITSYAFDCGNDTVPSAGKDAKATCTYSNPGQYTVMVTVTDSVGQTATAQQTVTVVNAPTVTLGLSSPSIRHGESVTATASASTDPGDPVTSYQFDCGNNSGQPAGNADTATCIYPDPGTYTVKVTVTDSAGQTATAQQTVNVAKAPTVTLGLSSSSIRQGEAVTATASASTDPSDPPVAYRFNCGAGGWGAWQSSPTAQCTYTHIGTDTVRVKVRDTLGQVSAPAAATVTVTKGVPPTARLSLSRSVIHRGHSITARAGASTGTTVSPINGYRFACGNGHRTAWSPSRHTSCHYNRTGRHTVKVWVRNTLGLVDTATRVVRVRP
ncbi:MAG: PKD domain-containing protein, partial [Nocardioides sp.]|nr:PKD domain-containing protein [Nocardioides sp.]